MPTANVMSVVVRRGTTTTSVGAKVLVSGHAAAAYVGPVSVDGVSTAPGSGAVRFVSQASTATNVQAWIIHPAVAASIRRVP